MKFVLNLHYIAPYFKNFSWGKTKWEYTFKISWLRHWPYMFFLFKQYFITIICFILVATHTASLQKEARRNQISFRIMWQGHRILHIKSVCKYTTPIQHLITYMHTSHNWIEQQKTSFSSNYICTGKGQVTSIAHNWPLLLYIITIICTDKAMLILI